MAVNPIMQTELSLFDWLGGCGHSQGILYVRSLKEESPGTKGGRIFVLFFSLIPELPVSSSRADANIRDWL
jgi:hypothetical protein